MLSADRDAGGAIFDMKQRAGMFADTSFSV